MRGFQDGKMTVAQVYNCLHEKGYGCLVEEAPYKI